MTTPDRTIEGDRLAEVIPFPNTGPTDDADIPSARLPVPSPTLRIPGLRAMFDREVHRLRELD